MMKRPGDGDVTLIRWGGLVACVAVLVAAVATGCGSGEDTAAEPPYIELQTETQPDPRAGPPYLEPQADPLAPSDQPPTPLETVIAEKYGVGVVECHLATGSSVGYSEAGARAIGRWMCTLTAPRTDELTGIEDTEWCVMGYPDNGFSDAEFLFPRSIQTSGEPSC
jgi:hypothetical protein